MCTSPDMTIETSRPDLINTSLNIKYKDMTPSKISGQEVTITCQGFKNPIFQDIWYGFIFNLFDSEIFPNSLEVSESVAIDATSFTAA